MDGHGTDLSNIPPIRCCSELIPLRMQFPGLRGHAPGHRIMAPQGCHAGDALETDWLAGLRELWNPCTNDVFEI
jgi:hypothetical protein